MANRRVLFAILFAVDLVVGGLIAAHHTMVAEHVESVARSEELKAGGGSWLSSSLWSIASIIKPDTIGRQEAELLKPFFKLEPTTCPSFMKRASELIHGGGDAYYLYQGLAECAESKGDVRSAIFWNHAYLRSALTLSGGSHDVERAMHDSFKIPPLLGGNGIGSLAFAEAGWAFDEIERGHYFEHTSGTGVILNDGESVRIAVGLGLARLTQRDDPSGVRLMWLIFQKRKNLSARAVVAMKDLGLNLPTTSYKPIPLEKRGGGKT